MPLVLLITWFLSVGILACTPIPGTAQTTDSPKREMRGAWIATVVNIDYPKQTSANPGQLKAEWDQLLDRLATAGMNAVFVQIRPTADALYPSKLVPWSRYLTGKQGQAPAGGFDPLAYMVQTAHARNMEFHAWLNPYRATFDLDTTSLAPNHVFRTHREWMLRYGPKFYLNPALPEVRDHVAAVVTEILDNYPVDGVHFDDYFYPYKVAGEVWPDSADFAQRGNGFTQIDDWRRANVDSLIYQLHRRIKTDHPAVEFGISPFGVWRNRDRDPAGSDTHAYQTCYDDLYADVRLWLQQGWIDYIAPQIYFHLGFEIVDYQKLLDWWLANSYGRKLYIGMAVHKIGTNQYPAWHEPDQMPRQLRLNRTQPLVDGHIFYSASQLLKNPLGITDSLAQDYFAFTALWPEKDRPASIKPWTAPELRQVKQRKKGVRIRWRGVNPLATTHWVIYRFPADKTPDWNDPRGIYRIVPAGQLKKLQVWDTAADPQQIYRYFITALDRAHRESPPSPWREKRGK